MNQRFKTMRKTLNLTQDELGHLIGISGPGIARIESGASKPTEAAIKLICATYNINYTWLTEGRGNMFAPLGTDELIEKYMPNESELTKAIMKAFAKLPDSAWYDLRDMIERVKKEAVI